MKALPSQKPKLKDDAPTFRSIGDLARRIVEAAEKKMAERKA